MRRPRASGVFPCVDFHHITGETMRHLCDHRRRFPARGCPCLRTYGLGWPRRRGRGRRSRHPRAISIRRVSSAANVDTTRGGMHDRSQDNLINDFAKHRARVNNSRIGSRHSGADGLSHHVTPVFKIDIRRRQPVCPAALKSHLSHHRWTAQCPAE